MPLLAVPQYFVSADEAVAGECGTNATKSCDEVLNDAQSPGNLRIVKVVRLLRLSKLLRLARIKRIMMKYQQSFTFNQSLGFIVVFTMIFSMLHLITCFWHMVGQEGDITSNNKGWVMKMELCDCDGGAGDCSRLDADPTVVVSPCWNSSTGNFQRYVTALYFVFNALEPIYETTEEKAFAVFAGLSISFIYGALAGIMGGVILSMQGGEKEFQEKIRGVRIWLTHKRVDAEDADQILKYMNMQHQAQSQMDEASLIKSLPPSLSRNLSRHLYTKFLATVPLFRGLSDEVLNKLCELCVPMFAMRQQQIIQEDHIGSEMYLVLKGEVEVTKNGYRLGFLSEGAFFGEIPILSPNDPNDGSETIGAEVRVRSVRAVTDCELCYIERADMRAIQKSNAELQIRMMRFARVSEHKRGIKRLMSMAAEELEIKKNMTIITPR